MSQYHTSVLKNEAIEQLSVQAGELYIDATGGGGGHTEEILKRGGKVLTLDRDPQAVEEIKESLGQNPNLKVKEANFSHIYNTANELGFTSVMGIIFDLGVSSRQLSVPQRGFSFQNSGPLDMRMDPNIQIKASDLINNLDKRRLNDIFQEYGQEKFGLAVADAICSARQIKPIEKTDELSEIVVEVYRKKGQRPKLHPATKVFQALRIVVNSELLNLEEALPQTVRLLKKDGRLVVISFHSLEDGIVKRFFKQEERLKILTKLPIGPTEEEIVVNPRARSAKMRVAQKI